MEMESPIQILPEDSLRQIFSGLSLRQIAVSRLVCRDFNAVLRSESFIEQVSGRMRLIAMRPHRQSSAGAVLNAYDADENTWIRLRLDFLPYRRVLPVAAGDGVVYLWADSALLVACNPITRRFRVLPRLGSAWARHATVLPHSNTLMLLSHLAALLTPLHPPPPATTCDSSMGAPRWSASPSELPSKPRSPVVVGGRAYALCDVGSPWRSQWKLFSRPVAIPTTSSTTKEPPMGWRRVERHEWGDVFDILRRPRLVAGRSGLLLMVGGLRSSFSLNSSCSALVVLRLRLDSLEWDEAARMPTDMFDCFQDESSKLKVFGGSGRVCFSAKRVPRIALWEEPPEDSSCSPGGASDWRWIDGVPTDSVGGGLCRGFVFEASLSTCL